MDVPISLDMMPATLSSSGVPPVQRLLVAVVLCCFWSKFVSVVCVVDDDSTARPDPEEPLRQCRDVPEGTSLPLRASRRHCVYVCARLCVCM